MIVPVIFSIFFTFLAHGQTKNIPPPNPPAIGNFANQRQPSTHFGFGQNIVPEQTFISYLSLAQNNIAHKNLLAFLFEWVYGITNYLSLYTLLPVIIKTTSDHPNGGVGDLLMQLEYAPYQRTTSTYTAQVTVIGNITIPTAHLSSLPANSIKPPIGFNAPTFFLGFTASYLSPQWYAYASSGAIITTPSICNTKFGNNILYQTGIGYNLGNPGGITLAGILELSGTFVQHTKINHVKNPNSGSNIILFGPCIYATHNRWEFWGGIQAPIVQNLNGIQNKLRYTTLFTISLTF